ncbi:MAG TPA: DinB family protein [Flavobacteriales bacterium]|nr:DinB family protein [Flavobacteriales bacterium]HMR27405.1 DinB family protein [Flavobacteriales bacterium]
MIDEARFLAAMMDRTREYTLYYLGRLLKADPDGTNGTLHKRFVCEGTPLNSAFWLVAHLATSENGLLLRSTGGPVIKFSWAKHYTLGAHGAPEEERPHVEEVLHMFHEVHRQAIAHVATLGDDVLSGPNPTGLPFGGAGQVRDVIMHAIRHEGSHIGHLGWLCKLHGIPTV